jgi:TolB-like protein/Tfp pilus assembly protein PilF
MDGSTPDAGAPAPEPGERNDVFLSYSRDDKPRAREVLDLLEAAGISVWWDDMLEGGTRFHQVTEFQLETAAAVVVLWSKISVASHWVHDEATRGRDRGVLIPVSIDGTLPPLGFRQFQWLDLSGAGRLASNPQADKLVNAIKAKRAGANAEPASFTLGAGISQSERAPATGGPAIGRRKLLAGGGVVLAGAAGLAAAWQGGLLGGAGGVRGVAVMPFDVTDPEESATTILTAIADEVRTQLARNPLLHVAAQTSSRALKDAGKTAGAICRELQVDYLLTGQVLFDGQRIDVNGELVDGRNERTILPINQAGPVASILALQRQIASDVIRELTSSEETEEFTRSGGTSDVAAYDAFLQGSELYAAGISEETDRGALAKFDEAIRIDPDYAAAHAMRGRTLALIANLYGEPDRITSMYDEAVASGREATRIAPLYAGGFGVIGDILANRQLDMKGAREPFETAARLGEGDSATLSRFALYEARVGDFARARTAIARALALDPLNPGVMRFAGNIEYDSRSYEAAIRFYRDALTIQADMSYAQYLVGIAQLALGQDEAARASFEKERRLIWRETGLAIAQARLGNKAAARTHLDALRESEGDKAHYQYMQVLAQWGEVDAALDAMDRAWEARDSGLVQFRNDPLLDPIRDQPRFDAMLAKIGFV